MVWHPDFSRFNGFLGGFQAVETALNTLVPG